MLTSIMVGELFKNEFKKENLRYSYPNERIFFCSQWRFPYIVYVVVRLMLAVYTIFAFVALVYTYISDTARKSPSPSDDSDSQHNDADDDDDGVDFNKPRLIFIYMTVWTYILLMTHMSLQALFSIIFYRRAKEYLLRLKETGKLAKQTKDGPRSSTVAETSEGPTTEPISSIADVESPHDHPPSEEFQEKVFTPVPTPWYFKLSWVVSDIVTTVSPIVTVVYFVLIYPTLESGKEGRVSLNNTNVHILNTVFILIDFAITARPVMLLHIYTTFVYAVIYGIFSILYWVGDPKKNIIYNVLNWNHPWSATIFVVCLLVFAFPLVTLAFFALDQLRGHVHKRVYGCTFDESFYSIN